MPRSRILFDRQRGGRKNPPRPPLVPSPQSLIPSLVPRPQTLVPYILWDWNGTLLDDTRAAFDTLNIMLARRGAPPIEMKFYLDNFAFPVRPFYEAIGMVLENEDWDALAREYHDLYHAQPKQLNPLALAALESVKAAGVGQSIISALRQDLLERDTAAHGVRGFMEHVAGVDNLDGASKLERARAFLAQLRAEHPDVSRFVMIGDALHDKEVADAIGAECILCGTGSHAAWRLAKVATTVRTLPDAVRLALGREPARAIVALGSNIEPRDEYLARARAALAALPQTRPVAFSSVIETDPSDVPPEFASLKFLNQVGVFETTLNAHDFSRRMHRIEDDLGRVRTVRNGPRTIDLDLIDFGGLVLNEPELTLPHPRAHLRDFVLKPLEELGVSF